MAKILSCSYAAGGGVNCVESARQLLKSGADKVVINSALYDDQNLIYKISERFGSQCIVGSIDIKRISDGDFKIYVSNGSKEANGSALQTLEKILLLPVGEWYLNSMDRDETGQGLDLDLINLFHNAFDCPLILAGGIGNSSHMLEGLLDARIDAVATANLFNFVGDGLKEARKELISAGLLLPTWDFDLLNFLDIEKSNDANN